MYDNEECIAWMERSESVSHYNWKTLVGEQKGEDNDR
jgi:hypothetical protein